MSTATTPITVALVNDYEIIVQGLAAMLAPFSERVRVVGYKSDEKRTRVVKKERRRHSKL